MGSILVLGLGKSGTAVASHVLDAGHDLTVYGGGANAETFRIALELVGRGARVFLSTEDVEGSYDLCIVSPGIPQTGTFYASAKAASKEIITEPEYSWRLSPEHWIAVTGTNGKTTTTSLTAHLLNASDMLARACGNIGTTCLESIQDRSDDETLVAELSSYQLASSAKFNPEVAVLLNITPDHLSWHGGFEPYAEAKFKAFSHMGPGKSAVIGADVLEDFKEFAQMLEESGADVITIGYEKARACAFVDDEGMLVFVAPDGQRVELVAADDLHIKGEHNVENALAAASAALCYGCGPSKVAQGLLTFEPLEHRIEPCGTIDGVGFFNDSKATNVDATLKALTAFEPGTIILLLGGRDKGTNLAELVAACEETCAAVITYGEAGQRFAESFRDSSCPSYSAKGMVEAFDLACSLAKPGTSILLSPACASFDEFNSFEHRGEFFKELVANKKQKDAHGV